MHPAGIAEATAAAAVAGAINSVSGGGTLITFPVLLGLGMNSIRANATSTVALWPAVIAAMWGYRQEMRGVGGWTWLIGAPSLIGGLAGAFLLLKTPSRDFDRIAPFLVLGATILFMGHGAISRWLRTRQAQADAEEEAPAALGALQPSTMAWFLAFQLGVGIYGGYFGAGIGILMLASLGIMGLTNIHRMNGLKSFGAFCMNGVAVFWFAANGKVDWPVAISMMAGSIAGGYLGSRMARRVGQLAVRRIIIGVGFAATISLLFRVHFQ